MKTVCNFLSSLVTNTDTDVLEMSATQTDAVFKTIMPLVADKLAAGFGSPEKRSEKLSADLCYTTLYKLVRKHLKLQ